jgi:cytochrome c oxidase assembly factor CtaG
VPADTTRPGGLAAARRRAGLDAIALLSTLIHTGMLGALLTFAPCVWYAPYLHGMLDALTDQQLGGLLMWVPGGVTYLLAALALVAHGLRPSAAAVAVADGAVLVKD